MPTTAEVNYNKKGLGRFVFKKDDKVIARSGYQRAAKLSPLWFGIQDALTDDDNFATIEVRYRGSVVNHRVVLEGFDSRYLSSITIKDLNTSVQQVTADLKTIIGLPIPSI